MEDWDLLVNVGELEASLLCTTKDVEGIIDLLAWKACGHRGRKRFVSVKKVWLTSVGVIFCPSQAGDLSMAARVSPLSSSGGATFRRRERRLRSFWRHEQCSIKMALTCAKHHGWQCRASVGVQTAPVNDFMASADVIEFVASAPVTTLLEPPVPVVHSVRAGRAKDNRDPALVIEHVAPAPAVTFIAPAPVEHVSSTLYVTNAAPAPVIEHAAPASAVIHTAPAPVIQDVTLAPADTHATPAPVIDFVAPSPVIEHIAPATSVTHVTPSERFSPACAMTAVTTSVSSDTTGLVNPVCAVTAVEAPAPQIVKSLPLLDEFASLVYNQIRQEQIVAEETIQNTVSTPVGAGDTSQGQIRVLHSVENPNDFKSGTRIHIRYLRPDGKRMCVRHRWW